MPPQDYWSNTSGNDIVRYFIEKVDKGLAKSEIEALVAGEIVTKDIHMDLTYDHIYDSIENIWSVLLTTGYLTQRGNLDGKRYQLAIPNMEIRNIFTEQIMSMFKENTKRDGEKLQEFCDALEAGKAVEVERLFDEYLKRTISIRDTFVRKPTKENLPTGKANTKGSKGQNPSVCFYHGMLLGLLQAEGSWIVKSNSESGIGFADIQIEIPSEKVGCVFEVKYAEGGKLDTACARAMAQIDSCGYTAAFCKNGIRLIHKYGIAFYQKSCKVIYGKEE